MVVPKTAMVACNEGIPTAVQDMRFPVVLKPRTSLRMTQDSIWPTGRPRYARDFDQLRQALAEMRQSCSSVLVQEFVEGIGAGYFALLNHGDLRAEFAHRRIRDLHPTGSGSVLRESVTIDPKIRDFSLAMLRALNWHGVAMIEYRLRNDGTPVFMEINGRFWHSIPLACYAGVDFPALLARMAEYGDVEIPPAYKVGVRCRWLIGDFRHLIEVWKGRPPGYLGFFPGRWSTLLAELTPGPGTFHDNFMLYDPLPELGDWIHFARQILSRDAPQEIQT
jgi:predicted ATP-grasp superfamily ATP-dependent carboligase